MGLFSPYPPTFERECLFNLYKVNVYTVAKCIYSGQMYIQWPSSLYMTLVLLFNLYFGPSNPNVAADGQSYCRFNLLALEFYV